MSDCIFMISVNFIKKISKTTIIIDAPRPTSPGLRLTGRLVLTYGPTCLGPSCPRAELFGTPLDTPTLCLCKVYSKQEYIIMLSFWLLKT